jgi:hypothetical protein
MKIIEPQAQAYNPEVQVKMTISEFKTILAIVACITPNEVPDIIEVSKSRETTKFLHDGIKPNNDLVETYHSMKEQYLAIPKKPPFQPLTATIESEEELIALRIALGRVSGHAIASELPVIGISRVQDEVDKIFKANYLMFQQFDMIFSGQVK